MYKRFQILLSDWQERYLRDAMELNDLSFSEMVRIILSEGILHTACLLYPRYKAGVNKNDLAKWIKKGANPTTTSEEKHRLIAKLYFEARKAAEYRLEKTRIAKKKSKKVTTRNS
ncbi:hypothetical protein ACFL2W_00315 [Candidatus Omnitrophota bacterium]